TDISPNAHLGLKTSARHTRDASASRRHSRRRAPGGDRMEMLAPASLSRCATFSVTTRRPTEFIDVTGHLRALVASAGLRCGFVNVQSLHTTTAIVVNEHEPLLLTDFDALLERMAP